MFSETQMLDFAVSVARLFEIAGISVIVAGTLIAAFLGARCIGKTAADERDGVLATFRRTLGRSILTGLELLVAADIIQTVAVEPTMESVLVLGGIVLIRTFLSLSLEVEIDGQWPWQAKRRRPD